MRRIRNKLSSIQWGRWFRFLLKWSLRLFLLWLVFAGLFLAFIHFYGKQDYSENADAIVILGAGTLRNGRAGPGLTRRTNQAIELWEEGKAPYLICSGGTAPRRPRSEAEACAELLIRAGVPQAMIILEDRSLSTEENAIYTLEITQERGWDELIVVSDGFHLLRARLLFWQRGASVMTRPVEPRQLTNSTYAFSMTRELIAFHWQAFKTVFGLPYTHVPNV